MDLAEDNVFQTSLIHEIKGISSSTTQIAKEIAVSENYLNSLSQSSFDLLSNNQQFKENPLDQIKTIKSILSKIRNGSIRFTRIIESTKLQGLNFLEKNELNQSTNEIYTTLNIIKEKQSSFNSNHLLRLTSLEESIENSHPTSISNKLKNKTNLIINHNNDIIESLNYAYQSLESTKDSIIRLQTNLANKSNLNYINKFKEDTNLIIEKYENEIRNLTEKFENKFKKFELDQNKVTKSSELLSTAVDAGLKNLGELNERTQNIELEFSKIIGAETQKVKEYLNTSRIALMGEIESITTEANTTLSEIKTAHTDFINLVERAGIYELTQNYKNKADEEKKDYKLNMWLTIGAIALAIIATIIVIVIPIIEHWKATPPVAMDYFTLFARLSISIMFFVMALYTSKQAAKHYECYQENHRTFLQLAALEPFMARMTPEEQKEIRKGLIPSYFNQSADGKFAAKGDEVDIPTNIHAIVNRAFDLVGEKKEPKTAENTATETKPVV